MKKTNYWFPKKIFAILLLAIPLVVFLFLAFIFISDQKHLTDIPIEINKAQNK